MECGTYFPYSVLGLGAPKFIDLGVLDVAAQDVFL